MAQQYILPPRIVRRGEVLTRSGLRRSTLYELISLGRFPRPFHLVPGGRAVGWLESDITEWILSRKAASQGGAQ